MKSYYLEITQALTKSSRPEKAAFHAQYFKTGGAGYGAGDTFLGVTVPDQRLIAKAYREVTKGDIQKLLHSNIHEYRLTALLILLLQYKKGDDEKKKDIFDCVLKDIKWINNWDLVDTVARDIFGHFVFTYKNKADRKKFFDTCIVSTNMWHQRIGVVATHYQIANQKNSEYVFYVCKKLFAHNHDLIHKAMGWMLREYGKTSKENEQLLKEFLKENYVKLPRTTLRYAIEKFSEKERKEFIHLKYSV